MYSSSLLFFLSFGFSYSMHATEEINFASKKMKRIFIIPAILRRNKRAFIELKHVNKINDDNELDNLISLKDDLEKSSLEKQKNHGN